MKVCSRCGKEHEGKYETCDDCRAYNNANKFIYALSRMWEINPDTVRDGMKKALNATEKLG